jgi:alkylated DNA repair dioxygenase AlkB
MKKIELVGFDYFQDFITESEEKSLVENIQTFDWRPVEMYGVTAKRRVVHFGLNYLFGTRTVVPTVFPPKSLQPLIERVAIKLSVPTISEILVTEYSPGAGIGWHKDAKIFGDKIFGLSLNNACIFKLRNIKVKHEIFKIVLAPRSGYILSGEIRTNWEHSISAVKSLRYSLTFRTLKGPVL